VYQRLAANVALNNISDRVVLHRMALTDRTCDVTLVRGRQTSVVPRSRPGGVEPGVHVVPGRRLDDVVSDRIALIKIDVEGMEPAVLEGGRDLITRSRPVIFAEAGTGPEYAAVCRVMRRLGYAPTGRSFNPTPTYEFIHVANPVTRWAGHLQSRVRRTVSSSGARRFKALLPRSTRTRLRQWSSRA
jgi:FkbM family methyltransferase